MILNCIRIFIAEYIYIYQSSNAIFSFCNKFTNMSNTEVVWIIIPKRMLKYIRKIRIVFKIYKIYRTVVHCDNAIEESIINFIYFTSMSMIYPCFIISRGCSLSIQPYRINYFKKIILGMAIHL